MSELVLLKAYTLGA